jgi:cysteine-rich repeat protein
MGILQFVIAAILSITLSAQPPYECFDAPSSSPSRALPLCGNGILDAGEVCDDGNQINFDGCNAFCSAFDGMSAAGTLAGVPSECSAPGDGTISGSTGQLRFCKLQAVAAGLDGSYVILADGATVLRYDLFTDLEKGNIRQLDASVDHVFSGSICSVAVLSPDSALLIHDCGAQQLYIATAAGTHVQLAADWSEAFRAADGFKAYYDGRTVVAAGVSVVDGTIRVRIVGNITLFDSNLSASIEGDTELAVIPRTAYSVWDDDGTRHSSYDTSGMLPRAVLHDACPPTFRAMQRCYVIYMVSSVHFSVQVFI